MNSEFNDVTVNESNRDPELEKRIRTQLMDVIDPELGIDIVNMGLVYSVLADFNKMAIVEVTLTTPSCPLTDTIELDIARALEGSVLGLKVNWTFNPPWSLDMISEDGKAALQALGFTI
jgi:metal-sulfur cluster biosynthetic enzyme